MRIRHNENLTFQYNHFGVNPSPLVENLSAFQDDNCVHIPIELHGKKLGTVVLRRAEGAPPWTSTEEELIKTCLKQAALALENARLVDETRHRAVREEILNQLTSSFSRSLDMDSVLQIAVQELGSLPTVLEASVHINPSHQELVFHGSDSVYKDGNNGHGEQVI
jgi:GAF domain-containing protein